MHQNNNHIYTTDGEEEEEEEDDHNNEAATPNPTTMYQNTSQPQLNSHKHSTIQSLMNAVSKKMSRSSTNLNQTLAVSTGSSTAAVAGSGTS